MMEEEVWKLINESVFERHEKSPNWWYACAERLRVSAEALRYCISEERADEVREAIGCGEGYNLEFAVTDVKMMLCGMALEVLYKAIVVAKGDAPDKNHELSRLAAAAGIDLNDEETCELNIFSEFVIYAGRYPVAKNEKLFSKISEEAVRLTKLKEAKDANSVRFVEFVDHTTFTRLWEKGNQMFRKIEEAKRP